MLTDPALGEASGPYEDPDEVESAWATEIEQRLQGIVNGTTTGVPNSEVREQFGL